MLYNLTMGSDASNAQRQSAAARRSSPPMTRDAVLDILRRELSTLREVYGVDELALFGSFAADQASAKSDVDLLVSFRQPPGLAFVELAERLERVLHRKVHLITRETVLREMESPRHRRIAIAIQEALVYA